MKNTVTGNYSLSPEDLNKGNNNNYYSCLRMRGYVTVAKYTSKIYDNATGEQISSSSFTHTYTYKSNKSRGLDYSLVARSKTQCNEIIANKYVGTNAEKKSIDAVAWKTEPKPATAPIQTWLSGNK